jgi:hypothetical protein
MYAAMFALGVCGALGWSAFAARHPEAALAQWVGRWSDGTGDALTPCSGAVASKPIGLSQEAPSMALFEQLAVAQHPGDSIHIPEIAVSGSASAAEKCQAKEDKQAGEGETMAGDATNEAVPEIMPACNEDEPPLPATMPYVDNGTPERGGWKEYWKALLDGPAEEQTHDAGAEESEEPELEPQPVAPAPSPVPAAKPAPTGAKPAPASKPAHKGSGLFGDDDSPAHPEVDTMEFRPGDAPGRGGRYPVSQRRF